MGIRYEDLKIGDYVKTTYYPHDLQYGLTRVGQIMILKDRYRAGLRFRGSKVGHDFRNLVGNSPLPANSTEGWWVGIDHILEVKSRPKLFTDKELEEIFI